MAFKSKYHANRYIKRALWFSGEHYRCHWCSRLLYHLKNATLEHIVPVSKGGRTTFKNCTLACSACNSARGSADEMTREQIILKAEILRKRPRAMRGAYGKRGRGGSR